MRAPLTTQAEAPARRAATIAAGSSLRREHHHLGRSRQRAQLADQPGRRRPVDVVVQDHDVGPVLPRQHAGLVEAGRQP